jgi:ABC-type Co2+ transport system permease subunit
MSDGRLYKNAPRPVWPRRGLILARNTGVGFAGGIALWILALLTASGVALVAPSMGPGAAAGAWEAAWTPAGFLYVGILTAALMALVTVTVWWAIDRDEARS